MYFISVPPVSAFCRLDSPCIVGVHLRTCIVLHGYFPLGKTSGPTTKATGSEDLLLSGTLQGQESVY